jgi:hypothetical protein
MVLLLGPICLLVCADDMVELEVDTEISCLEDRLRSLGILSSGDDLTLGLTANSTTLKGIDLEADMPQKKVCLIFFGPPMPKIKNQYPTCTTLSQCLSSLFPLPPKQKSITPCYLLFIYFLYQIRASVLSMVPSDAYKLLRVLVAKWQSRFVLYLLI